MDLRIVSVAGLIFLCLLVAPAASRSVSDGTSGAVSAALKQMLNEIKTTVDHLDQALPQNNCSSKQSAELDELQQKPLLTERLSAFRCRLMEMSKLAPELSAQLLNICQHSLNVEKQSGGQAASASCSLPSFEQHMDTYLYLRCLLQRLSQEV